MEDILSSIKRIIAEEGEGPGAQRPRRTARTHNGAVPGEDVGEDEVLDLTQAVDPAPASEPEPATPAPQPDTILSERVAEASRDRLDSLSRLIVKPEVEGSDTLEGLVRELLRPMLRDWLDANLPGLVERLVSREIERISSQPR